MCKNTIALLVASPISGSAHTCENTLTQLETMRRLLNLAEEAKFLRLRKYQQVKTVLNPYYK